MKRQDNLFIKMCTTENIRSAEAKARKGKGYQYGIKLFDLNREENLSELRDMLFYKEYTTSAYKISQIKDPKTRDIYALPYYPDRIVHHMAMNILEPMFKAMFSSNSYSSVKGMGITKAVRNFKRALCDQPGTQYCLKIDLKKFYESVDHDILKSMLRRKIKDPDMLWLLDDVIDSAPGIPIGNFLSQYFANFYLTYFDHWLKQVKGVKHYFRYCDDMVIMAATKEELHDLLSDIKAYLFINLKLTVKSNYQVFPVDKRGVDFIGYVFYHTHTRLRKGTKKRFAKKVARGANPRVIAGYYGWAKQCNSRHLLKKLLYEPVRKIQHQTTTENIRRFKDIRRRYPESNHNSSRFQHREIKIPGTL